MIALGEGAGENYPVWSLRKQNRLNAVISLRAMPGRLSGPFSNEHPECLSLVASWFRTTSLLCFLVRATPGILFLKIRISRLSPTSVFTDLGELAFFSGFVFLFSGDCWWYRHLWWRVFWITEVASGNTWGGRCLANSGSFLVEPFLKQRI